MKKILTSLRTEILLSLTLLLVAAMGLTGFIVFRIWERDLLQNTAAEGRSVIGKLQLCIDQRAKSRYGPILKTIEEELRRRAEWFSPTDLSTGILVMGTDKKWSIGDPKQVHPTVFELLRSPTVKRQNPEFRVEKKGAVLLVMGALFHGRDMVAVAQVPISMEQALHRLTQSQKLVWFYIGLNIAVLIVFGTFLLSRVVVKPIRRLMKTADHFEMADDFTFGPETDRNEIAHLTRALNRMLKRLTENKERMADQIEALEKANRELKEAREVVLRSEKLSSLGRLAAGVAHEVGNPLGSIMGYTDLLKPSVEKDQKGCDYLDRIEDEISRVHHIVRDLLDFSRPAGDQLEPVDVNTIVSEAVSLFSKQKSVSLVALKTTLSPDTGVAWANGARLKQVLINLLFNASDAVTADGFVTVSTARTSGPSGDTVAERQDGSEAIEISVSDNGTGILEKELGKIFEPFYTTKPPGKGTGLGLAVSQRIVASFGGSLLAESTAGKGSVFTIRLKTWSQETSHDQNTQ